MKVNIKKILKILLIIVGIIIVLLVAFLLYVFINHKLNSSKELKYLANYDTGKIINIDGKEVNYKIFNEDNTKNTIILMGGSGVTDLSLSFYPLAREINAKIILINRPGYGSSSDSKDKADIEYIVNFYRNVLKKLNITDKIILMPHSISGMYAMYWAQLNPSEIAGIIGLDIGSPYLYVENSVSSLANKITYLGSKVGIHRFIYKEGSANTAIKNYDIYEDEYFKAIWYMNMINPYSKFNLSEENLIKDNAYKVINNMNDNYYQIKKLYIIADSISGEYYEKYEKENLYNYYKNEENVKKYITNIKTNQEKEVKSLSLDNNTSFTYVEGSHALYYYPSRKLIENINQFLESEL